MINTGMKMPVLILCALSVVLLLLLSSCEQQGEKVEPTLDRTGEPVQVTVYFYPSSREVTAMYRRLHNIPRGNPMPEHLGFAMWPEWRNGEGEPTDRPPDQSYECEVHTVQPRVVNDNATMTLGHELLHCLYGSYHRDHWGR